MTNEKARSMASLLGGEHVDFMPSSQTAGVRLGLADGRVALIDELGGETYRGSASPGAYPDHDVTFCEVTKAEWDAWGVTEMWATGLARLIGGRAHQSGGNIWVVLLERKDGSFLVLGDDGAEVYKSTEHFDGYYDGDWPEPEYVYWTEAAANS